MHYIKWNEAQTSYEIWHGPSIGVAAMTAMGYVRVETLPVVTPETPPLDSLVFSKYQVAKKLMGLGLWENIKSGLSDEQRDFLYLAQDFSLADPNFAAIYSQLKSQIPDVEDLLRECVLT